MTLRGKLWGQGGAGCDSDVGREIRVAAAVPVESSGQLPRVRGGFQGCPLRGVRPRRWLCGCRARTARGSAAPEVLRAGVATRLDTRPDEDQGHEEARAKGPEERAESGETMDVKAKPASTSVKVLPLKKLLRAATWASRVSPPPICPVRRAGNGVARVIPCEHGTVAHVASLP